MVQSLHGTGVALVTPFDRQGGVDFTALDKLLAHKPTSTRYGFEEDILPIFRAKCSACHRPDGPAPMSLRRPHFPSWRS